MATVSDSNPYEGLIPLKLVRGDLISSEFLLDRYLNKAEDILKDVDYINGVDKDYIKHLTYQENVLSEHLYPALLSDTPTRDILKAPEKKPEEIVFGPTLYYPAEDVTKFYNIENHLRTYIDLEVNKHFGLSLLEYVNLTVYEMETVNKVIRDYLEALRLYREKQERSLANTEKDFDKKG